jgi:hypothetical protein
VKLLLQVFDVLIRVLVLVRVFKLKLVFIVLTSEVHFDGGFVTGRVTELGRWLFAAYISTIRLLINQNSKSKRSR